MDNFDLRNWPRFAESGGDPHSPAIIDQIAIDSRCITSPTSLFVALKGSSRDGHAFIEDARGRGARFALVNQSFQYHLKHPSSLTVLRVDNPLAAFQEICGCYRKMHNIPVLAITGSQGKTMLKDLLALLLGSSKNLIASPESFNSQIGAPLSLLQISSKNDLAIIEAGISLKGEMETLANIISPTHAILTRIGNAHLTTLKSLDETAAEKLKLLEKVPEHHWVIVNSDKILNPYLADIKANKHFWDHNDPELPSAISLSPESTISIPCKARFPDGFLLDFSIPYEMPYLLELINMGIKAAWLFGASSREISERLEHYSPEPMQTEIWTSPLGATFINDSYSADPASVALALKNLKDAPPHGKKIFIFGGLRDTHSKSSEVYKQVADSIAEANIHQLLLVGSNSLPSLKKEVSRRTPSIQVVECQDQFHALREIRNHLRREDMVLIQGPKKERLDLLVDELNDLVGDNRLTVNLSAIEANLESIKRSLPPYTRLMPMIKAHGYGTDNIILARFFSSCNIDILGVAHIDEAIALRRAGISQKLFVINAALYEVQKLVKWEFEIGVSSHPLLQAIEREAIKQNKQIKVHLHVDTGMSRLGCRPEETLSLARQIVQSSALKLEGLMTHLACADLPEEDAFTMKQAAIFRELVDLLSKHGINPPWKHASNSSGSIRSIIPEGNMARIGLSAFGIHPSECTRSLLELQSALTLTSRIAGINTCKQGDTISYGRSYKVETDEERIGVVPLGYFDGLHRCYSGKGYVYIRGKKAPLVGTICMDFFMVNLSDIPDAAVGDPVLIFGQDPFGHLISPEEFASRAGTSVYELITCLGPRIQRVFIKDEH